ncbi:SDR family oxidoreductase [Bradyrhizobium daqingense]|uniref:SDR family oxidoreductase n=1 Tax=Bradyrhizobium daqingense TaxID=993502 RepID=UPI0038512652
MAGELQVLLRIPDHHPRLFFSCFHQGSWLPLLVLVGQFTPAGGQETNHNQKTNKRACERIPGPLLVESEDLAALAVFLASPMARYITGTMIPVDGGLRRINSRRRLLI